MKMKIVKLRDVKSYENNPRKNEPAIAIVMKSIKNFGFKVPIILDKDNIALGNAVN